MCPPQGLAAHVADLRTLLPMAQIAERAGVAPRSFLSGNREGFEECLGSSPLTTSGLVVGVFDSAVRVLLSEAADFRGVYDWRPWGPAALGTSCHDGVLERLILLAAQR